MSKRFPFGSKAKKQNVTIEISKHKEPYYYKVYRPKPGDQWNEKMEKELPSVVDDNRSQAKRED